MTRPSKNTDQKLISVARKLLPQTGCSGLNLRDVAKRAKVNLGMFHYYFKSKDEFTRRVLEEIYGEFFDQFQTQTLLLSKEGVSPLERLEGAVFELGRFGRDNRDLVLALMKDMLNGNQEVVKFIGKLVQKHLDPIREIVQECQRLGQLPPGTAAQIIPQIVLAVNGPQLALALLDRIGVTQMIDTPVNKMKEQMADEEILKKRVQRVIQMMAQMTTEKTNKSRRAS